VNEVNERLSFAEGPGWLFFARFVAGEILSVAKVELFEAERIDMSAKDLVENT
jgi:hypothetical protein